MTNTEQKILKPKLGVLELAKQLESVSQACKAMGYSRDSFYRFKKRYESGEEEALREIIRKKPIVKNPALGQMRVSHKLLQLGIVVSAGGVRSIWIRHDLEKMSKHLKALEACFGKGKI